MLKNQFKDLKTNKIMKKILYTFALASIILACKSKESSTSETTSEASASMPEFSLDKSKLSWTAFKTPEKVGVSGSFDDISLDNNHFTINTKSVNSGNPERDTKLKEFFFGNLSDSLIVGNYGTVDMATAKIPVTIKMNGIEKTFQFDYSTTDSSNVVSGSIDIVSDFSGNVALEGIHNACKELHMGKTWSDVSLKVETKK